MSKLTLADAEAIVDACIEYGKELGKALSVVVVDAGGFMLVSKRSDGARPLTPSIALSKAYSAAVMQRPTKMLKPWAENNPTFFSTLTEHAMYPVVATDGGVTLKRDSEILGGVGVSGGTASEDEEAADAVLERLGYELDFPAWGKPADR